MSQTTKRNVHGVKISDNHGKTWKIVAICTKCIAEIEPPRRAKKECLAGALRCDWCGVPNAMGKQETKAKPKGQIISDGNTFLSIGHAISKMAMVAGERMDTEDLPTDLVILDIAYSPVIPYPFGKLSDAVEVEKLSDYSYRFEYLGEVYTVTDEQLKEMRARYIVTHNKTQLRYMALHNPNGEGHGQIWRDIAEKGLASYGEDIKDISFEDFKELI